MNIKDYVANNNQWRASMTPLDSDYITWEKSAGGIRPCVNREAIIDGINASGSLTYNGYFKVIATETGVKVVNGADTESTICGSFTAGSQNVSCIAEEIELTGSGVVYINIWYDADLEEYDYEFNFAAELPSVDQEIYITLASIADGIPAQVWTDGAITYLNASYWL